MEAVPTNLVKEFNREFNELDKYETLNIAEVGIRLDRCQDYLERRRRNRILQSPKTTGVRLLEILPSSSGLFLK